MDHTLPRRLRFAALGIFVLLTAVPGQDLTVASAPEARPAPAPQSRHPVAVLIARPADASFGRGTKDLWFGALAEQILHFKMGAIPQLALFPHDSLFAAVPRYGDLSKAIRRDRYLELCRKRKIENLIVLEYELIGERDVACFFELISTPRDNPVVSVEKTVPLTATARLLDSCLARICAYLKVEPDRPLSFFLRIPAVSENVKNLRQLGSVIVAEKYTEQSEPGEAGQEYHKIAGKDPGMHLANYLGARAFLAAKSHVNGAVLLDRLLLSIGGVYPRLHVLCAQSYRKARRPDDALRIAILAEKNGITSAELTAVRAETLKDKGEDGQAKELYSKIQQQDAEDPHGLVFFAQQSNKEDNPDKALELTNKLLAQKEDEAIGYLEKGRALAKLGRDTEAKAALSRAAELAPDDPDAPTLLGDIAARQNQFREAGRLYFQAIALLPDDLSLRLKAASAFEKTGDRDRALKLLRDIEPEHARNPELQKRMGLLEYALRDSVRARNHLEAFMKGQTKEYVVLAALGDLYLRAREYDQALRMYTYALPLAPDKNPARLALARIHLHDSSFTEANAHLDEILTQNPSYPQVNRYRGDSYMLEGKPQDALRHYEIEKNSGDRSPYLQGRIARLRYSSQDWKGAQREYAGYIKSNPDDPQPYFRLALISLQLGSVQEAEGYLRKGLSLGKADPDLFLRFGARYAELKMYAPAAEAYNQCLVLSPGRQDALLGLAQVYEAWGRDSSAAAAQMSLFELNKEQNREHLLTAARLYLKSRDSSGAEGAYGLFLERESRPSVRIASARLKFALGKYPEAIGLLEGVGNAADFDEEVTLMFAQSYMLTGQHALALPLYVRILERNPQNRQVIEFLAASYEKTENLKQAAAMYERYLALPVSAKHADFAFRLGQLYEQLKAQPQAFRRYEKNLAAYPADPRSFERLGELYLESRDYQLAIAVLRRGITVASASPNMKNLLAQAMAGANDKKGAVRYYADYLKSAPNDTAALLDIGAIHFAQKDYQAAIPPLRRALEQRAGGFDGLYMLGISYLETGRPGEAAPFLRRAHEKNPSSIPAASALATAYRATKDRENLTGALKNWADLDTTNYDVQREAGNALFSAGKTDAAVPYFQRAVRIKPGDVESHMRLAGVYRAQGKGDLAIYHLSMAVRQAPALFEPHFELGRHYFEKADFARALPHLKKAVALDPTHGQAVFALGKTLAEQNDPKGALPYLALAVRSFPDSFHYEFALAKAYYRTGNASAAVLSIRRAASLCNNDADILYWAGFLHFEAGHFDSARRYFKSSASVNKACRLCYEYLGDISARQNNHAAAAAEYDRALRLDRTDGRLAFKMGQSYYAAGRTRQAEQAFEKVVRLDPRNQEALYLAGHLNIQKRNVGKAEQILRNQSGKSKTGWLYLLSGEASEARGKNQPAYLAFSSAARMLPANPAAQSGYGRMFLAREDYTTALGCFNRALASSPDYPPALVGAGLAYAGLRDNTTALRVLKRGVEKDASNPQAFATIARIESQRGNHVRAIEALRKGIKAGPREAGLYMALGKECRTTSRFREAVSAYKSALRLGGDEMKDAHMYIGNLYYESLRNRQRAKEHYLRYVKAGGRDPKVRRRLSRL